MASFNPPPYALTIPKVLATGLLKTVSGTLAVDTASGSNPTFNDILVTPTLDVGTWLFWFNGWYASSTATVQAVTARAVLGGPAVGTFLGAASVTEATSGIIPDDHPLTLSFGVTLTTAGTVKFQASSGSAVALIKAASIIGGDASTGFIGVRIA